MRLVLNCLPLGWKHANATIKCINEGRGILITVGFHVLGPMNMAEGMARVQCTRCRCENNQSKQSDLPYLL